MRGRTRQLFVLMDLSESGCIMSTINFANTPKLLFLDMSDNSIGISNLSKPCK